MFGFLALAMASVNIFGGFLVTQRMLGHVQEEGAEEVSAARRGQTPNLRSVNSQSAEVGV